MAFINDSIERIKLKTGDTYPVGGAYRTPITSAGANDIMDYTLDAINNNTPKGTLEIDLSAAGQGYNTIDLYKVSGAASHFTAEECRYISGKGFTGQVTEGGQLYDFIDFDLYNYGEVSLNQALSAFIWRQANEEVSVIDDDQTHQPFATTYISFMNIGLSGLILGMGAGTYTATLSMDIDDTPTTIGTVTLTLPSNGIYLGLLAASDIIMNSGAILSVAEYELDDRYTEVKIPEICIAMESRGNFSISSSKQDWTISTEPMPNISRKLDKAIASGTPILVTEIGIWNDAPSPSKILKMPSITLNKNNYPDVWSGLYFDGSDVGFHGVALQWNSFDQYICITTTPDLDMSSLR